MSGIMASDYYARKSGCKLDICAESKSEGSRVSVGASRIKSYILRRKVFLHMW